jgi:FG-GAP repeat protein
MIGNRTNRTLRIAATGALILGSLVAVQPAASAALTCNLAQYPPRSDIDGDGVPDVVVGTPRNATNAGFVVDGSRGVRQYVTRGMVTNVPTSSDFGMSLDARQDFNGDGCFDLVVGDPGVAGGGAVDIFWGSPSGVVTHAVTQILAHTSSDSYGTAVATDSVRGVISDQDFGPPRYDLWVGAPGRTVSGHAAAGAIDQYRIAPDGGATFQRTITQAAPTLHGAAAGNQFGALLDATSQSPDGDGIGWGLLVGVPNETVNGHAQAGAVYWIISDSLSDDPNDTSLFAAQRLVQGMAVEREPNVAGVPEAGDHFGAAVVISGVNILIGVPDEDIGRATNAGMIQTFAFDEGPLFDPRSFSQASPGVPGGPEAGDRFGAAVTGGLGAGCPDYWAIGVPGEDLGSKRDAGYVELVPRCSTPKVAVGLSQGSSGGLGGAIEAGDRVGAVLHGLKGNLAIGVPGEDLGASVNTGVVLRYHLDHAPTTSFSDKGIPWVGFGRVIGY